MYTGPGSFGPFAVSIPVEHHHLRPHWEVRPLRLCPYSSSSSSAPAWMYLCLMSFHCLCDLVSPLIHLQQSKESVPYALVHVVPHLVRANVEGPARVSITSQIPSRLSASMIVLEGRTSKGQRQCRTQRPAWRSCSGRRCCWFWVSRSLLAPRSRSCDLLVEGGLAGLVKMRG